MDKLVQDSGLKNCHLCSQHRGLPWVVTSVVTPSFRSFPICACLGGGGGFCCWGPPLPQSSEGSLSMPARQASLLPLGILMPPQDHT